MALPRTRDGATEPRHGGGVEDDCSRGQLGQQTDLGLQPMRGEGSFADYLSPPPDLRRKHFSNSSMKDGKEFLSVIPFYELCGTYELKLKVMVSHSEEHVSEQTKHAQAPQ